MLFYYVCHRGPVNFNIYSKLLVLQYMLHFCRTLLQWLLHSSRHVMSLIFGYFSFISTKTLSETSTNGLLGPAWASPTVMWLTEASAMHYGAYVHGTFLHWLKSHRYATGTSTSLLFTCQLCFQVHNLCVHLHGFAFRKTLHISQDVTCWQSWSNNNSKYGLVRRTYTIYYGRTRCFRAIWRICFWQ